MPLMKHSIYNIGAQLADYAKFNTFFATQLNVQYQFWGHVGIHKHTDTCYLHSRPRTPITIDYRHLLPWKRLINNYITQTRCMPRARAAKSLRNANINIRASIDSYSGITNALDTWLPPARMQFVPRPNTRDHHRPRRCNQSTMDCAPRSTNTQAGPPKPRRVRRAQIQFCSAGGRTLLQRTIAHIAHTLPPQIAAERTLFAGSHSPALNSFELTCVDSESFGVHANLHM